MEMVARDPVCGAEIDTDYAFGPSDFEGIEYYFCGVACLEEFENDPELYAGEEE